MGYENRDYARDDNYSRIASGEAFLDSAPVCKWLIIITVGIFVMQIFVTRPVTMKDLGQVDATTSESSDGKIEIKRQDSIVVNSKGRIPVAENFLKLDTQKTIFGGQIWRLLTSAFCHSRSQIWHIVFNMLLLFWFGRTLESLYGSKEFLLFYLVAAVLASLAYCGLQLITGERMPAIGASGAIMAVVCLYTMWYPRDTINFMMIIPIEMRFLLLFYAIYDLHPVVLQLAGSGHSSGVGHAAHLGGLLFGFLYYRRSWQLLPIWNRVTSLFSKRKLHDSNSSSGAESAADSDLGSESDPPTPSQPERSLSAVIKKADDRLDSELDKVLAKISAEGEESLNDRERKVLERASQRYRNR